MAVTQPLEPEFKNNNLSVGKEVSRTFSSFRYYLLRKYKGFHPRGVLKMLSLQTIPKEKLKKKNVLGRDTLSESDYTLIPIF